MGGGGRCIRWTGRGAIWASAQSPLALTSWKASSGVRACFGHRQSLAVPETLASRAEPPRIAPYAAGSRCDCALWGIGSSSEFAHRANRSLGCGNLLPEVPSVGPGREKLNGSGLFRGDHSRPQGEADQSREVENVQAHHQFRAMVFDGFIADFQDQGDGLGRLTFGQQLQDFTLA